MCGIAGIVNFNQQKIIDSSLVKRMTESIRHRGPDGEGYLFSSIEKIKCAYGNDTNESCRNQHFIYSPSVHLNEINENWTVQLGHRRLSIIDLSPAGHQPMCTTDARYWITYNGEIYNYIELRKTLSEKGFLFKTQTDTEVILHAYQNWGSDCVKQFNGMWSFVIYDRIENIFFGSRDRFGVKPFYYFKDENHFAFASEQKALLQLPFVQKEINPTAVFDFFALNKLELEETGLIKNIFELQPAHSFILNISNGDFKQWKYYQLQRNKIFEIISDKKNLEYISTIRGLVKNSINLRLRSDAPVGSCLSGGIDSSVIVCVVNDLMKEKNYTQIGQLQNAFTTCFADAQFDESHWAKTVVEKTKTKWHRVYPQSNELLKDMEKLIFAHDVPIWSTSSYAHYRVMQLAKESGLKVLLDGQGGDELFGGYKHYELNLLNEFKSNAQQSDYRRERKSFDDMNGKSFLPKLIFKRWIEQSDFISMKKLFFNDLKFVNPDLLRQHRERWELLPKSPSSLNEAMQNDFDGNYLKELLLREDRNGMIHSVEARTPFADDPELIEYVFNIPGVYKIRGAKSKYLLREAFKDLLPTEVYNRNDKKGFSSPNNKWMSELREQFRSYFDSSIKDYVNLPLLLKQFDSFFNNPEKPENYRTLKFISFAVWMKVFDLK